MHTAHGGIYAEDQGANAPIDYVEQARLLQAAADARRNAEALRAAQENRLAEAQWIAEAHRIAEARLEQARRVREVSDLHCLYLT